MRFFSGDVKMRTEYNLLGLIACIIGCLLFLIATILYIIQEYSVVNLVALIITIISFIIVTACTILYLKSKNNNS